MKLLRLALKKIDEIHQMVSYLYLAKNGSTLLDWKDAATLPPVGIPLIICYYADPDFKQYAAVKASYRLNEKDGRTEVVYTSFMDGTYFELPCVKYWAVFNQLDEKK